MANPNPSPENRLKPKITEEQFQELVELVKNGQAHEPYEYVKDIFVDQRSQLTWIEKAIAAAREN